MRVNHVSPTRMSISPAGISTGQRLVAILGGEKSIRWLLYLCVFENCGLSVVNNLIITINSAVVISCQIVITIAAISIAIIRRPMISPQFFSMFFVFLFFIVIAAVLNGGIQARFLYDVSLVPIFIFLGSTVKKPDMSLFVRLFFIVLAVALIELVYSDGYLAIFNPRKYFNATRDWAEMSAQWSGLDSTTYGSADFYLGALRGGYGTIFGAPHRIGSIFLEPLGLAYFSVILCMLFIYTSEITGWRRALLIIGCVILAGLSDTRSAVFLIFMMLLLRTPLNKIPRDLLYLAPMVIILAAFLIFRLNQNSLGETEFRLSLTFDAMSQSGISKIIFGGLDKQILAVSAGDSGLVYFTNNVGIFGYVIYIWISSGLVIGRKIPVFIISSVTMYIVVLSFFGEAFLSIKTACLLGYGIGAIGNSVVSLGGAGISSNTEATSAIRRRKFGRFPAAVSFQLNE